MEEIPEFLRRVETPESKAALARRTKRELARMSGDGRYIKMPSRRRKPTGLGMSLKEWKGVKTW